MTSPTSRVCQSREFLDILKEFWELLGPNRIKQVDDYEQVTNRNLRTIGESRVALEVLSWSADFPRDEGDSFVVEWLKVDKTVVDRKWGHSSL